MREISNPPVTAATTAFTPGPWFWTEGKDGNPTSLRRSGSGDVVLAPDNAPGEYAWVDMSEADARLIEATPDLYAALAYFVEAEDTGLENDELDKFSALARAALAKANGERSDA